MFDVDKFSDEQKLIKEVFVDKNYDVIVNAFAGTGKTTTAIYVLSSLKGKRLYLVFNRQMRQEARKRITDNSVEVSTFHSLAFRYLKSIGYFDNKLVTDFSIKPYELAAILDIDKKKAYWVTELLKVFLYSDVGFELMEDYVKELYDNSIFLQRVLESNGMQISQTIKLIEKYIDMIRSGKAPIFHDFYLKDFCQIIRKDGITGLTNEYEFLVVDESQDVNPILLQLLESMNAKKMIIGDKHQRIYQFRSSTDIHDYYLSKNVEELFLTESFRFGNDIASTANIILGFKGECKKIVGVGPNKKPLKKISIIARKNSSLFKEYLFFYKKEPNIIKYFTFERELSEVMKTVVSVLLILMGIPVWKLKYYGIDTAFCDYSIINSFRTKKELEDYIKNVLNYSNNYIYSSEEDSEGNLKQTAQQNNLSKRDISKYVIDEYRTSTDEILTAYSIVTKNNLDLKIVSKIIKDYYENSNFRKEVFLTTAHSSKGQEYQEVYIVDDLSIISSLLRDYQEAKKNKFKKLEINKGFGKFVSKKKIKKIQEDINLLYVSVTRASHKLELSENVKDTIKNMQDLNNSDQ
ncbi:MAG: AAA family ATPase [Candidatus Calescibacterium sp.]|nr:AAA family ATPase [Candidatus Calescibacterium sp.]MDW8133391.1 AAA family ATPase [Candidatus Calescibacterium sp.]